MNFSRLLVASSVVVTWVQECEKHIIDIIDRYTEIPSYDLVGKRCIFGVMTVCPYWDISLDVCVGT